MELGELLNGASVAQQREQNHPKPQEGKENPVIAMKWDFPAGKNKQTKESFFQGITSQTLCKTPVVAWGSRCGNGGARAPVPIGIPSSGSWKQENLGG